ncbi:DUF2630 family protein [Arthrobacter sp. ISL-69]|uniref:DUF2630 family protein n=1 Tax=Arthrobacter sp. ISL-69 TaxID=2819113 RepID=UPI001BE8164A|nr:DUF2630 family protein [Arthrobacter sp. ISL-69]MBT2538862.1 DUF2630 family protein [Arthrobacter sp. ISL-69]
MDNNQDIFDRIQALVTEEHRLREESAASWPHNADEAYAERRVRLRDLEEDLDKCWALLRRRRAGAPARTNPFEDAPGHAHDDEGQLQKPHCPGAARPVPSPPEAGGPGSLPVL